MCGEPSGLSFIVVAYVLGVEPDVSGLQIWIYALHVNPLFASIVDNP